MLAKDKIDIAAILLSINEVTLNSYYKILMFTIFYFKELVKASYKSYDLYLM